MLNSRIFQHDLNSHQSAKKMEFFSIRSFNIFYNSTPFGFGDFNLTYPVFTRFIFFVKGFHFIKIR